MALGDNIIVHLAHQTCWQLVTVGHYVDGHTRTLTIDITGSTLDIATSHRQNVTSDIRTCYTGYIPMERECIIELAFLLQEELIIILVRPRGPLSGNLQHFYRQ